MAFSAILTGLAARAEDPPAPPTATDDRAALADPSQDPLAGSSESVLPEERRRRLWGEKRAQPAGGASATSHEERLTLLRGEREGEPPALLSKADLEYRAFIEREHERYRLRVGGGAALTALGGAALIASLAVALSYAVPMVGEDLASIGDHGDGEAQGATDDEGSSNRWVLPVALLAGGVAGLAAGIPLLVTGRQGMQRMLLLRAPAPSASVSFFADPRRSSGGLRLKVAF